MQGKPVFWGSFQKMAEQEFRHIVRVMNTDLDGNKKIGHALMKIRGVGFAFSNFACQSSKINATKKTGELSDNEIEQLNKVLTNPLTNGAPSWMLNRRNDYETGKDMHLFTSDVAYLQGNDIKRMKMIKSYKGLRHQVGLPVRGQRTKSNFRRNKGKVMGVKRKAGKVGRV